MLSFKKYILTKHHNGNLAEEINEDYFFPKQYPAIHSYMKLQSASPKALKILQSYYEEYKKYTKELYERGQKNKRIR